MDRHVVITSNAQKLKEADAVARERGTQAVGLSPSGNLYLWDDKGRRAVKATVAEAAAILDLPETEVQKWVDSKGAYLFDQSEGASLDLEEKDINLDEEQDEVDEDEDDDTDYDDDDYNEPVYDEAVEKAINEVTAVAKELANANANQLNEVGNKICSKLDKVINLLQALVLE